jgi:hypothetical protein
MKLLIVTITIAISMLVPASGRTPYLHSESENSPKRIELKAGAAALTLEGQVSKSKDVAYVFTAKAGQKFSGRMTKKEGNIGFEVTGPDGQGLPEEEFDFNTALKGTLEKTGDYKISVATFEEKPSKYTLVVRVY